jgi:hypothetical protein
MHSALYDFFRDQGSIVAGLLALAAGFLAFKGAMRAAEKQVAAANAQTEALRQHGSPTTGTGLPRRASSLASCAGGRSASKASAARLRARARPAMAVRSTTGGAGRMIFAVRSAAMTPATIGAPPIRAPSGLRRRLDHEGQVGVAARSQAERRRELERMAGHRLRSSRVIREGGGRNPELRRQPLDKDADRLLHVRQPHPRMAD